MFYTRRGLASGTPDSLTLADGNWLFYTSPSRSRTRLLGMQGSDFRRREGVRSEWHCRGVVLIRVLADRSRPYDLMLVELKGPGVVSTEILYDAV